MTTTKCQHHWIIDPSNGHTSQGKCQNCHEFKDFENSFEKANFDVSRIHYGRDNRQDGGDFYPQGDREG